MTRAEMRRAPTLALVIRWAMERDERGGDGGRDVEALRRELVSRGVDVASLRAAIDADGSRS